MQELVDPKALRRITTTLWIIIDVITHCHGESWLVCSGHKCDNRPQVPFILELRCNSTELSPELLTRRDAGIGLYDFVTCQRRATSIRYRGISAISALDVESKRIFWGFNDQRGSAIYEMDLDGSNMVMISQLAGNISVSGLSYDWIGENVYVAKGSHVLMCARRVGNCRIVYESVTSSEQNDDRINNVAVDPNHGLIFFGTVKYIARVNMDGSEYRKIVRRPFKNKAVFAVDHEASRIVWADTNISSPVGVFYYSLGEVDYEGAGETIVVNVPFEVKAIAVLRDVIFWTDILGVHALNKSFQLKRTPASNVGTYFKEDNNLGWRFGRSDIGLIYSTPQPRNRVNHCTGGLCANKVCVLTAHYFKCLEQGSSQASTDGFTCHGVAGTDVCTYAQCSALSNDEKTNAFLNFLEEHVVAAEGIVTPYDRGNDCESSYTCLNGACVDYALVCDGKRDCEDCSDEGPRCEDECGNIQCEHRCHRSPLGRRCTCGPGYRVAADNVSCHDVDECQVEPPVCENTCLNYNGSYKCVDDPSGSGKPDHKNVAIAAAVPTVVVLLVVAAAIYVAHMYLEARKVLRKLTPEEIKEFLEGDKRVAVGLDNGVEQAMLLPFRMIIQPDDIAIAREAVLGSGHFGIVYQGFYKSEAVAIKTFKRTVEIDEFKAVLAETKIMAYLGQHEHVIKLIGAEISLISERKIALVTELSPHGDLLHYLRKIDPSCWQAEGGRTPKGVNPQTLVSWCSQIASGMEHLELKKIVHGDLATRNVLVFKDNVVKITDFGLSKQLYANSEYRIKRPRPLPWKWCALELLTRQEFSTDSDIWAFGVTAWEIFSLGRHPYEQHQDLSLEFIQYLEQGNRMGKPEYATHQIHEILLECWNVERSSRPRFAILKEFFGAESINFTPVIPRC